MQYRPGVLAVIGELVTGRVPEHLRMNQEAQAAAPPTLMILPPLKP
jgi:hypothetical protein